MFTLEIGDEVDFLNGYSMGENGIVTALCNSSVIVQSKLAQIVAEDSILGVTHRITPLRLKVGDTIEYTFRHPNIFGNILTCFAVIKSISGTVYTTDHAANTSTPDCFVTRVLSRAPTIEPADILIPEKDSLDMVWDSFLNEDLI